MFGDLDDIGDVKNVPRDLLLAIILASQGGMGGVIAAIGTISPGFNNALLLESGDPNALLLETGTDALLLENA